MTYPTWEEIFNKPYSTPTVECPPAWCADTLAVEIANQECARLIANCMVDQPTNEEIKKAKAGGARG